MTDPFRKSSRKYIPLNTYQKLFDNEIHNTLISSDLNKIVESKIKHRRSHLEEAEEKEGFVFLGEKSWLASFLSDRSFNTYPEWVEAVFRKYLKLDFTFVAVGPWPDLPEKCWKTILENPGQHLPCFDQLLNPAFEPAKDITHVEIHIYGTEEGPDMLHLSRTFEFLFDLEYMIAALPAKVGEGGWVGIEGLDVVHPDHPEKWELIVRSGYGAEFDYAFDDRIPV